MSKKTKPNGKDTGEEVFYIISIASSLSGMHPQTLRSYDKLGLVSPTRTSGKSRLYSARDIEVLLHVQHLVNHGVNLAGVKRILELELIVESTKLEIRRLKRKP